MPKNKQEVLVKETKLPESLGNRLREKMMSDHEDEIIELMKQKKQHVNRINEIDAQIESIASQII